MRLYPLAAFATVAVGLAVGSAPSAPPTHPTQGQGVTIVLENEFIKKYMDRATMETEFRPVAKSANHKPKDDGEVHIGGVAVEAKLAAVAEVMNVATTGKKAADVFAAAIGQGKSVKVTGAWRLWCEHSGGLPQVQKDGLTAPLPGLFPSNPDHVFEIHPVTSVRLGDEEIVDAAKAVGATPGHTPHDPQKAFHLGYDRIPCKIAPVGTDRTKIVTQALGFNFTEFVIRLNKPPFALADGHAVEAAVFDPDGELISLRRRMVFIKGTAADDAVKGLAEGKRLQVIGIPRISLKLVNYRLEHKDDKDEENKPLNPLDWNLPYEMIVVSAIPVEGDDN